MTHIELIIMGTINYTLMPPKLFHIVRVHLNRKYIECKISFETKHVLKYAV